jgi:2,5-diamino-6-(ribosylamino)-4(3H)-pyrimidinone 5'-phosphate reductase
MSRPFVVAHYAVSVDGATTGFPVDLGRYYSLAATWSEEVTLTGADTVLAQEAALAAEPGPGPAENGALLAVVDGRRRVTAWAQLRDAGYWSGVLGIHAVAAGPGDSSGHDEIVVGTDRVDLAAALEHLAARGATTVRVDSGGGLGGALLERGLVDEVSLLVHPVLAGGNRRWYGRSVGASRLDLVASQTFDDQVVWLRYRVTG